MKQYTYKDLAGMKIGEQRQILRAMNKEARLRASRLKKHGYGEAMQLPPIMDWKRTSADKLIKSIGELQIYLRNPRSRVSGMKRINKKTLDALHAVKDANGDSVYDFVTEDNLADFGRFMNMVRQIHGATAFPSDEVVEMYKRAEKLGISRTVIKDKFGEYLTDLSGITDLNITLETMSLPEGRKRISSTEVMDKMRELGLWLD